MKQTHKRVAVLLALGLGFGFTSSAMAQDPPPKTNGFGGTGNRPPMTTNPASRKPQPAPPAAAVAARNARDAEEQRTGRPVPLPVYDPNTGGLARHPDGSLVMSDELPGRQLQPCITASVGCPR